MKRSLLLVLALVFISSSIPAIAGGEETDPIGYRSDPNETGSTNPFKVFYQEPEDITSMELWERENIIFIGCEHGLIRKDLNYGTITVFTAFEGLYHTKIVDLSLDQKNGLLYIIQDQNHDIFVFDVNSNEVVKRITIFKGISLVDENKFRNIQVDPDRNKLYVTSNAGLLTLDLMDEEYDFFDFMFFNVPVEMTDVPPYSVNIRTLTAFGIYDIELNPSNGSLYLATELGLSIFNPITFEFANFRNNSALSGRIYSLAIDTASRKLYLGKERLTVLDLENNETEEYPFIYRIYKEIGEGEGFHTFKEEEEKDSNETWHNKYVQNIIAIGIDPVHRMILTTTHGHYGWFMIPFRMDDLSAIRFDELYKTTGAYSYSDNSNNNIIFNPNDGLTYHGKGATEYSTSSWEVSYTYQEIEKYYESKGLDIHETVKESSMETHSSTTGTSHMRGCMYPLITFDPIEMCYSNVTVSNSILPWPVIKFRDFCEIVVFPDGRLYLGESGRKYILDRDLTLETYNDYPYTYDVRLKAFGSFGSFSLIDDIALVRYWEGERSIGYLDLTTFEVDGKYHEELGGRYGGITKGEISNDYYIMTENGLFVLNQTLDIQRSFPFPGDLNYTWYGERHYFSTEKKIIPCNNAIAVDEEKDRAYITMSSPNLILLLNLSSGNYSILSESLEAGLNGIGLDFGQILMVDGFDEPFIQSSAGIVNLSIQFIEVFPMTGTVSDIKYIPDEKLLICVTGDRIHNPEGSIYQYSSEFQMGLLIFDLESGITRNFSWYEGVPGIDFSSVDYDPESRRIYGVGERYFFYVDMEDLDDPIEYVIPPETTFYVNETPISPEVLNIETNKQRIPYLAIASGGLISIFIGSLLFESVRFKIFSLMVPLFSKLKEDKILDNENRSRILRYIQLNPGEHYSGIKKDLKLRNGTLAHHLGILIREKKIKSRNSGLFKLFYPGDMNVEDAGSFVKGLEKEILELIMRNPGSTQTDIQRILGKSPSTIHYHVDSLQRKGIIMVRRDHGSKSLFLTADGP